MIGLRFTYKKSVQLFFVLATLAFAGGFARAQDQDILATAPVGAHSTLCGESRECELARQARGIACLAAETPDSAGATEPSDDPGAERTCSYREIETSCAAIIAPEYVASDSPGEGQRVHHEEIDVGMTCVAVDVAQNENLPRRSCNAGRECNREIQVVGNERLGIDTPVRAELNRSKGDRDCDRPTSEGNGTCSLP